MATNKDINSAGTPEVKVLIEVEMESKVVNARNVPASIAEKTIKRWQELYPYAKIYKTLQSKMNFQNPKQKSK